MIVSDFESALSQLDMIEAAVKAGDLEMAQVATQKLKPLLVSERIDQVAALKARVDALVIGVRTLQQADAQALMKLRRQRVGIDAYHTMQSA